MGKKKAANGQHFNLWPKIVAVCGTKTLEFNTRLIDYTELLYPSIAHCIICITFMLFVKFILKFSSSTFYHFN